MGFQVSKITAPCIKCGKPCNKGDRIWWTLESRGLEHAECHGPEPEPSKPVTFKKKRVTKENRCTTLKTLMGMTSQCSLERGHGCGHSFEFHVGEAFWERIRRAKETDTLRDIVEKDA